MPAKKAVAKRVERPRITKDVKSKVVKEIPPQRKPDRRTQAYAEAMADVRKVNGRGKPTIIAEFTSPSGASSVRRMMLRGERPIDGKLSDWVIQARRHDGGSTLYVTLR